MVEDDTQPPDAQPLDARPQDAAELAEEVRRLRRRVDRERQARRQAEDIAEEATGRLYRALRHLEREHDELRQLVAASTHDVKNPLATIKGFAELLASGRVTGADAEHMLGRLVVNAEFTGELIDGMLDVLEAGLRERAAEPADLDLVMDEVIAGVSSRHPRVQVEAARLGAAVIHRTDARRLLDNLVDNAARHAGRPDVVVGVELVDADRRQKCIRIADNGHGIAADDREAVFEIFRRGSDAVPGTGTGVGLAVCRRLARTAGGDLVLDDDPGPAGGAAFLLRLPV